MIAIGCNAQLYRIYIVVVDDATAGSLHVTEEAGDAHDERAVRGEELSPCVVARPVVAGVEE